MSTIVLTEDEWDAQFDTLLPTFTDLFTAGVDSTKLGGEVKSIVDDHATSACVEALATALIQAGESSPKSVDTAVQAIASLRTQFGNIQIHFSENDHTFLYVFDVRFLDLLNTTLNGLQLGQPSQKTIDPSNQTLTSALLSASALQHGLTERSSIPYRLVYDRLQLNGAKSKKGKQEVNAIGALIHLALAGKKMMAGELGQLYDKEAVVRALKENVAIEHSRAQVLLQETVKNAENNFSKSFTAEEAWNVLFPN
ncbi:hypothetical protein EST38_g12198 [Candolleomyces aberdarensis]|uniref:Uncharacterized protein n=1 Tax=Candolleomyces aberdarensis TaxID=2316362 RepID=A0A4Q2D542_9AGAR|nr:hypothetical protein EST38_g12198 [Candolleomyces aberdarensis]